MSYDIFDEAAAYGEAPDIPFGYEAIEGPDGETVVVSKDELCPGCGAYVGADDGEEGRICDNCGEVC